MSKSLPPIARKRNSLDSLAAQAVLSFAFLFAGGMKLLSGAATTKIALLGMGFEEPRLVATIAAALPYFELLLGCAIGIGIRQRATIGVTIAFLAVATVGLVTMGLNSGWSAPCNCAGTSVGGPIYLAVIRNFVFLGLAFWVAARQAAAADQARVATPV